LQYMHLVMLMAAVEMIVDVCECGDGALRWI
jgi:hypothetical protein